MAAGIFSFSGPFAFKTNSDFNYTLTWSDANGNPINLTGYAAKMSFADTIPVTHNYLTLSSAGMSPNISFNPSAGQIFINVPQSLVSSSFTPYLESGQLTLVYDMLLYPPEDGEFIFLQGPAQALAGVTTP